jgi:hypothetical protein
MKIETAVICVLIGIALFMTFIAGYEWNNDRIAYCKEDAVMIGEGSYENGQWTHYICGPSVDDFAKES